VPQYTTEFFEHWRKDHFKSDSETVKNYVSIGAHSLNLVLSAAARPGAGKLKDRLPAVWLSFTDWLDQTAQDFKLEPEIEAVLELQKWKQSISMTYGEWRKLKPLADLYGFTDNKRKPDSEQHTEETEERRMWNPGSDMRPPTSA
jgi:hypothetical protein